MATTAQSRTESQSEASNTRGDAKRRSILAGATRVFLANGYGGTTMDAVAAEAGASKMTVYRHFDSKEALFAGVIEDLCVRMFDGMPAFRDASEPSAGALRRFGRAFLRTVLAPETVGLLRIVIAEAERFPDLGRRFYESGPGANLAMLTAYLAAHGPDWARAAPEAAADRFLSELRGYTHLRMLLGIEGPPSARDIERAVEAAVAPF